MQLPSEIDELRKAAEAEFREAEKLGGLIDGVCNELHSIIEEAAEKLADRAIEALEPLFRKLFDNEK